MKMHICIRYRYLFYLLLLIPLFVFRDYTPANELKYLSIAEEAIQNGRWFTFYNHGEIYADKPPLFFWLVMLSRLITGGYHAWLIGLFSLVPAVGVMAIMDNWLKNERERFNPLAANLILLTTAMFLGATLIIRMDMLMTFFIVLALYTFYRIYKDEYAEIERTLLPVYIFLALFSKGPIGLLVPVASIMVFLVVNKQIRTFGHYFGLRQCLLFAGLCAVWLAFVFAEGGGEYIDDMLLRQTVGRGVSSFHHREPFWFYFPRMLWSFAPWSLLFLVLIWNGLKLRMLTTDLEKFLLAIVCTTIILLSIISSKLDIYLLPVYPFVVYLCSILLHKSIDYKMVKIAVGIPAILFACVLPVAIIAKDKIPDPYGNSVFAFIGVAILAAGAILAIIMLRRNRVLKAVFALSGGIVGLVFISSFAMPDINKEIGLGELAKSAESMTERIPGVRYAFYRFGRAANMDVYLGSKLLAVDSVDELDWVSRNDKETILFVKNSDIRRYPELAKWLADYNAGWSSEKYRWYLLSGKN